MIVFQVTEGDPGPPVRPTRPEEAEGRRLWTVQQVRRWDGSGERAGHRAEREERDGQTEGLPGEDRGVIEEPTESGGAAKQNKFCQNVERK